MIYNPDFLSHHGIKGQKWGVKNGPPYPLDAEGHKSFKRNKEIINRNSKDPNKRISKDVSDMINSKVASDYVYRQDKQIIDGYEARFRRNAQGQMEYATHTPTAKLIRDNGMKEAQNNVPLNERTGLDDNDMASINPGFGSVGTTNNCNKCTAAAWMRDHGYSDVQAGRVIDEAGTSVGALTYWFDDVQMQKTSFTSAKTDLGTINIPGKSGAIAGTRDPKDGGGGHIVYWRTDDNGDVEYCDGQTGKKYSSIDDLWDTQHFSRSSSVYLYDMSSAKPNFNHMAEDGVIRREVPVIYRDPWGIVETKGSGAYDTNNGGVYNRYADRVINGQNATRLKEYW